MTKKRRRKNKTKQKREKLVERKVTKKKKFLSLNCQLLRISDTASLFNNNKKLLFSVHVMAFLRSIARCNQSYAVSRKFSTSIRSGGHRPSHHRHALPLLNHIQFTRAELLACQKYYFDLRRELNTVNNNENITNITEHQQRSAAMSTLAATKPAAASSATTATSVQNSNDPKPQRDPLDVSFNDPIAAFKSKTTWELIRAYFVYLMCSSEYLVENNMKVKKTSKFTYDF